MTLVYIVVGFLVPVAMVFGYSVLLSRRRKAAYAKMDQTIFSQLVDKCTTLKNASNEDNGVNAELDSVLEVVRTIKDPDIRDQSLSQVMCVYMSIGCKSEAEALLQEVEVEVNRTNILKEVFGKES